MSLSPESEPLSKHPFFGYGRSEQPAEKKRIERLEQHYTRFRPGRKNALLQTQDDEVLLKKVSHFLKEGGNLTPSFQFHLGKFWIKRLEGAAIAIREGEKRAQAEKLALNQYKRAKAVLKDEFIPFRNGFLAEYAVARSLQKVGFDIYYPSESQDMNFKVDWWLTRGRPDEVIAAQVKCITVKGQNPRGSMVMPIDPNNPGKSADQFQEIWGVSDETSKLEADFKKMADSFKNIDLGKGLTVRPICIILPSPDSPSLAHPDYRRFDPVLGEPDDFLGPDLKEQINARLG